MYLGICARVCVCPGNGGTGPAADDSGGTIYNQDLQQGDLQAGDFVAEYHELSHQLKRMLDKFAALLIEYARTQLRIELVRTRSFLQRYSAERGAKLKHHKDQTDWSASLHIKTPDCEGGDLHILEHGADNAPTTVCAIVDECEHAHPRI